LKFALAGGMATQTKVMDDWKKLTGCTIFEGYGLSETSPVLSLNPFKPDMARPGTIGLPVCNTRMRIMKEDGTVGKPGERGEIQAWGPQVMLGYWNKPEETVKVLDGEHWFSTGDIGTMDEDGFFTIVDRKKDMILVSGFNVYPNEVEDFITTNPKVLEACAIGVADEKSTEAVKLFVVKKDESLTEEEVIEFCKEGLTGYKVPKHVEFIKEVPKSPVGKLLRKELRN